jgi:regulator of replication initiation timing
MKEYKEILKAIEQRLTKQKEQLEDFYRLNEMLTAENRKLQKENKQLRDDLCELSREYTKNNKK